MSSKNRLALAALPAAAALVALLATGTAAPAQDLQSKLEDKEAKLSHVRERKGVLTTTISHFGDRIDRLTAQVASLRTEEAAVRTRLAAKQKELDGAVGELDVGKRHLAIVRARLRRALVALRERLVAMYETGTPDVLSVILGAGGYEELVDRTAYLERIQGMDEAVIGRVRTLRDQVKRTVARLRTAKDRIESARDSIAAEEQALAGARKAVQDRQSTLVATRAERMHALDKINEAEEELDGDVGKIQAEIASQLSGYGSAPLAAGPIQPGNGSGLIWPVDGPVVSGFGPRTINGQYEFHPGIDIAVPSGTPIRAAAAGTVVFTEPESSSGGYGNYTCIDHGGGLSTCYAHQESFAVSAGQSVEQGQVIGYSDCTGYCFGPHVHFEVRIGGEVTDPMGYLWAGMAGCPAAPGSPNIEYPLTRWAWHAGVEPQERPMIRQAHAYVAGAMSGTVLIAAAVVVFVFLVSVQAAKDWPFAGLVGGDSGSTSKASSSHPATGNGTAAAAAATAPVAGGRSGAPAGNGGSAGGSGGESVSVTDTAPTGAADRPLTTRRPPQEGRLRTAPTRARTAAAVTLAAAATAAATATRAAARATSRKRLPGPPAKPSPAPATRPAARSGTAAWAKSSGASSTASPARNRRSAKRPGRRSKKRSCRWSAKRPCRWSKKPSGRRSEKP